MTNRRDFLKEAMLAAGVGALAGCATKSVAPASKPTWIDLQVNGRVGVSFTDEKLTEEGVLKVVETLRDDGTAAFLATIVTSPHYMPMFISDGFHLPKEMLHAFVRVVPLERLITVTDCAFPGGLPPGRYERNGRVSVLEPNGFLRSPATQSLAGSSCLMRQCVETLMSPEVGLSYADCLRIGRENPLRLIGLEGWTA